MTVEEDRWKYENNDHVQQFHYWAGGVDEQQTQTTKQTHHGEFLPVVVGCDCVPAASDVAILLGGGGLVDVDATAGEVCDADA